MTNKHMNVRIQHKHGLESEWALAVNFTPLLGELIIYDADENNISPRVKFGNGIDNVNDLPFLYEIDYASQLAFNVNEIVIGNTNTTTSVLGQAMLGYMVLA